MTSPNEPEALNTASVADIGKAASTIEAQQIEAIDSPDAAQARDRAVRANDELGQRISFRYQYAPRVFWLAVWWLGVVLAIVIWSGVTAGGNWMLWPWLIRLVLPDTVLIALVTTTTAAVLGLLAIVIGDLFPRGKRQQ